MATVIAGRFRNIADLDVVLNGGRMTPDGLDANGDLQIDRPNDQAAVDAIRRALHDLGGQIEASGPYDGTLVVAVREFKIDQGLPLPGGLTQHDGVTGPRTMQRLDELFANEVVPTGPAPVAVDPPGLAHSPAFAQGMIAPAGRTLYVGGQNGTDAAGTLLRGVEQQTQQALRNVLAVLAAAGAGPQDVVKLSIYLAPGIDPAAAFAASAAVWGAHRTAITVLTVMPAKPGALVEIDAVASLRD